MGLIGFGPAWDLGRAIAGASRKATRDRYATVTRRDPDGVTWGTIAGASGEVPLGGSLADAEVGDVVAVDWRGGVPVASGNATSPSVGARRVEGAVAPVRAASAAAQGAARAARSVADAAQKVAEAVNQHFFADTSGIHVTEATQDEWESSHTGANVLLNSAGQLFRDGMNNLLTLTTEGGARALTIWDGLGNAASNVRAVIGDTITLGRASESHAEIDYNSLQFIDGSGSTFFLVNDAAEVSEATSLVEIFEGTGSESTLTLEHSPTRTPIVYRTDGMAEAVASVDGNVLTLVYPLKAGSIAIVTYATTDYHAVNGKTMILGTNGNMPLAAGAYSASVGTENQPSGDKSMTVGNACWTVDPEAFASGGACLAAGEASVAHGLLAKAIGIASFAQGGSVVAYGPYQHAIGRYNEIDIDGKYPFVIGNGTANGLRSNALTVGWDGQIQSRSPVIDRDGPHDSGHYHRGLLVTDKDGDSLSDFGSHRRSNGAIDTQIETFGNNATNWLLLRVNEDGTKAVLVSDPAAWRAGLGLDTAGALVTVQNCTMSSNAIWKSGNVVTVNVDLKLSATLTSSDSRRIGTVPSGYRPLAQVFAPTATDNAATLGGIYAGMFADGGIYIYNRSGQTVPTSASIVFTFTYVTA